MKRTYLLFIPVLLILLAVSCSSSRGNRKRQKTIEPKILLTSAQLEKFGFEKIDGPNFKIYLFKDGFILGNSRDSNIIRYKSPGDIRQYKASGQGPGSFLYALNIFKYDEQTVGIHDYRKKCVLLFDSDLNYREEIKVHTGIRWISSLNDGKRFIASGFFDGKIFAFLDKNFEITGTFVSEVTKPHLPRMAPRLLNKGYFLNEDKIAFTQGYYTEKECRAEIYDVDTKKVCLTLTWEQDHNPTEKDRLNRKNRYFSRYIYDYNGFYLKLNYFAEHLRAPYIFDLIIFDKNGKIRYRDKKFPFSLIKICNTPKSGVYFITENDDLAYIEFKELLDS